MALTTDLIPELPENVGMVISKEYKNAIVLNLSVYRPIVQFSADGSARLYFGVREASNEHQAPYFPNPNQLADYHL